MGAWDTGAFDNDDAQDLSNSLKAGQAGVKLVRSKLEATRRATELMEWDANAAVAAAAIVLAGVSERDDHVTLWEEEARDWAFANGYLFTRDDVTLAAAQVCKILHDEEMLASWPKESNRKTWQRNLQKIFDGLCAALKKMPQGATGGFA